MKEKSIILLILFLSCSIEDSNYLNEKYSGSFNSINYDELNEEVKKVSSDGLNKVLIYSKVENNIKKIFSMKIFEQNELLFEGIYNKGILEEELNNFITRIHDEDPVFLNGYYKEYNQGLIVSEGYIRNMKNHGTWKYYYSNQIKKREVIYNDDEIIDERFFDDKGTEYFPEYYGDRYVGKNK